MADSMISEEISGRMKPSAEVADWEAAAVAIAEAFAGTEGAGSHIFMVELSAKMNTASWPAERRLHLFGHLDTEHAIGYLRENSYQYLNWQLFFDSKAAWGNPEELQNIYPSSCEAMSSVNLSNALVLAMTRGASFPGAVRVPDPEIIDMILLLGASPAQGFNQMVEEIRRGHKEIGRVFARHAEGQKHINFKTHAEQFRSKGDFIMYRAFHDLYLEYGRFRRVDHETLEETKDDLKMRVIFNFAARRVTEIYEMASPPVLRDFSFDDYEENALHQAHEKLIAIGGAPADSGTSRWDKKITRGTSPALSKNLKDPQKRP